MVTIITTDHVCQHSVGKTTKEHRVYCLSTDVKPTDVPNATPLFEIDTGVLYVFDEDQKKWHPQKNET